MKALIPNRYLFDFEFPMMYRAKSPVVDGELHEWGDVELLPKWGELDDVSEFADVWACWNESGIYLACRVQGKRGPLHCDVKGPWTGDHLRVCTDMRDARSAKRATRFCQMFYFLPTGGGRSGDKPCASAAQVPRAQVNAPLVPAGRIPIASTLFESGYSLEAHLPADVLAGFDPAEHPRIGFYYSLTDAELGQQTLTVGDELYASSDPSSWPTAVLQPTT